MDYVIKSNNLNVQELPIFQFEIHRFLDVEIL